MSGVLVLLLYITCLIMGFFGGIFGYFFEDNRKRKRTEDTSTGKWIPQDFNKKSGMTSPAVYYFPKCSVCGGLGNYEDVCPHCGAHME